MRLLVFLRDTVWVGYALYFRPAALKERLRTRLGLKPVDNLTQLPGVTDRLDGSAGRSYLAEVALLCALSVLPCLRLVLETPWPLCLALLGMAMLLASLGGLGAATWDTASGVGGALVLGILLGSLAEPDRWLTAATSARALDAMRQQVVPGVLSGMAIGFTAGIVAGVLARRRRTSPWRVSVGAFALMLTLALFAVYSGAFVVAFVVAFVLTFVAVLIAAVVVADDIEGKVSGVVTLLEEVVEAGGRAGVVAGVLASSVVVVVAFGVAFSVAGDLAGTIIAGGVAFVVAVVMAVGVAVGMAGLITDLMAGVVADSVAFVVAVVMAVGVAVGGAGLVAGIVAALPSFSAALLVIAGVLMGISFSSRRWGQGTVLVSVAFLAFIGLVFLPIAPAKALVWFGAGAIGFLRLPIYGLEVVGGALVYVRGRRFPPLVGTNKILESWLPIWRWDELIPFPLPLLDRYLVAAVQQDRRTGLTMIEEVAGTWRQGVMAQRALVRLAAIELAACKDEQTITAAAHNLAWLPETTSPTIQGTLSRFRAISTMLDEKRSLTDSEAQLVQLSRTTAALDDMIQGLTFVPNRERELFLPVAWQWRTVLRRATTRLPNPYVAGDPLRGDQPGLFVGREDVLRDLLAHLRERSQRPTLVLYGQRRMGKSSLLYQLPHRFDDQTVPVRVDCQAAEMQESNAAFLFNLARAIQRQAQDFRQIELPPAPSLAIMTATAFSGWLELVESRLGERVLLLCLDEFERIGKAVSRGWLDERILDFLRNLIQHHSRVTVLLAGSHRPEEISRPWSNYLISAVVLPIGYLRPDEVEKLVTQPIPGFPLHYRPEAVHHIIQLTRCQPLLVQLLCQQLVILLNERGEREAGVAEVEAAVPGALSQGGSLYFTYLAEYDAGAEGQVMLRELARHGPAAVMTEDMLTRGEPAREEALRRLLSRDLVERVDGGIRFQVELTRRWWESHGPSGIYQ